VLHLHLPKDMFRKISEARDNNLKLDLVSIMTDIISSKITTSKP